MAGTTSCSDSGTAAGGNASGLGTTAEPAVGSWSSRICGKWSSPPLSLRAACAGGRDVAQGEPYEIAPTGTVATDATATVGAKAGTNPSDWLAGRAGGSLLPLGGEALRPSSRWKRTVKLADVAFTSVPLIVATIFLAGPGLA